eukprot:3611869-Prymnesium_polylepis.1
MCIRDRAGPATHPGTASAAAHPPPYPPPRRPPGGPPHLQRTRPPAGSTTADGSRRGVSPPLWRIVAGRGQGRDNAAGVQRGERHAGATRGTPAGRCRGARATPRCPLSRSLAALLLSLGALSLARFLVELSFSLALAG